MGATKIKGYYCKKQNGDCGGTGSCHQLPDSDNAVCNEIWAPVCGCDGQTYSNECHAINAGVNIAGIGECDDRPPHDCGNDELCK